jgi:hypothetical protein
MMDTRPLPVALALLTALGCSRKPPPSPEAAIEQITQALQAGDGDLLWRSLPASMKGELGALMRRMGQTVDSDISRALDALVVEAAEILSGQEGRLAAIPPLREKVSSERLRGDFARTLIQALQAGGSTGLLHATHHPEQALERAGPALARVVLSALRAADSPLVTDWPPGHYHLQPLSDGRMAARREEGPDEPPRAVVRLDGRWVPERWLTDWRALMGRADPWLAGGDGSALVSHGPQILRLLNQTRARLRRLKGISDQPAFDRALSATAGTLSLAITWAITPDPTVASGHR